MGTTRGARRQSGLVTRQPIPRDMHQRRIGETRDRWTREEEKRPPIFSIGPGRNNSEKAYLDENRTESQIIPTIPSTLGIAQTHFPVVETPNTERTAIAAVPPAIPAVTAQNITAPIL